MVSVLHVECMYVLVWRHEACETDFLSLMKGELVHRVDEMGLSKVRATVSGESECQSKVLTDRSVLCIPALFRHAQCWPSI